MGRGLNLKIVAAVSPQLFAAQEPAYRASVLADEVVAAYSLSSDWDDRWRTGGMERLAHERAAHLTRMCGILNRLDRGVGA